MDISASKSERQRRKTFQAGVNAKQTSVIKKYRAELKVLQAQKKKAAADCKRATSAGAKAKQAAMKNKRVAEMDKAMKKARTDLAEAKKEKKADVSRILADNKKVVARCKLVASKFATDIKVMQSTIRRLRYPPLKRSCGQMCSRPASPAKKAASPRKRRTKRHTPSAGANPHKSKSARRSAPSTADEKMRMSIIEESDPLAGSL